jgi:hypothetical protein
MPTVLTREMFSITVDGARAVIRIWRRTDLDHATGAANAVEMAAEGAKLPGRGVREIVLDLREAPGIAGPKTSAAIAAMLARWGTARIRIAVLITDDPLKTLQFRRLVTDNAPKNACVTSDLVAAEKWFRAAP